MVSLRINSQTTLEICSFLTPGNIISMATCTLEPTVIKYNQHCGIGPKLTKISMPCGTNFLYAWGFVQMQLQQCNWYQHLRIYVVYNVTNIQHHFSTCSDLHVTALQAQPRSTFEYLPWKLGSSIEMHIWRR
jgi:hypothetical protein